MSTPNALLATHRFEHGAGSAELRAWAAQVRDAMHASGVARARFELQETSDGVFRLSVYRAPEEEEGMFSTTDSFRPDQIEDTILSAAEAALGDPDG